jgi:hypothetical protein
MKPTYKKITKTAYVEYLNNVGFETEDNMVIGGKLRKGKYGNALRKYDPIAFEVGYNERIMEYS